MRKDELGCWRGLEIEFRDCLSFGSSLPNCKDLLKCHKYKPVDRLPIHTNGENRSLLVSSKLHEIDQQPLQ